MKAIEIVLILLLSQPTYATINILFLNDECAILASDTRITAGQANYISSESFEKIAQVSKFVAARIQENMSINQRHFKAFLSDFKIRYNITDESPIFIDSVVFLFTKYIDSIINMGPVTFKGSIGFAGLDCDNRFRGYSFYDSTFVQEPHNCPDHGYFLKAWGAIPVYERLINGIDPLLIRVMKYVLLKYPNDSILQNTINILNNRLGSAILQLDISSINDAINFVYTLVRTTIIIDNACQGRYTRNDSITYYPSVGGDVIQCIITREGIKWIRPPNYCVEQ